MTTSIPDEIKRLRAIAETGLLYNNNEFDKERYEEIREISFRMLGEISKNPVDSLKAAFPPASDYPTAKVDIRGMLLSPDKKILLVRESADGKWSLPGGWADIGYSPKEVIVKEFKEETGIDITVTSLLAVFDKRLHVHPPQPFYVYKMVFYCNADLLEINKGFDVLDVGFFDINDLPALSEDRILQSQVELLYKKIILNDLMTLFD